MSEALAPLFDRVGGSRRISMSLVALGGAGIIWAFSSWAMAPIWVPIGQNMPMEMVSEASQRLEEEGIEARLERGGTSISVQENQLARARVALAASGITNQSAPGFELFDQPSWGMTDFTQRINYRRALEGELERTLGQMRGITSAQVHLTLPETSVMRSSERPAQASVVLGLASGVLSDKSMVEGIAFLVASSVEGLSRDNVMILDDGGRPLSDPDAESGMGMSQRQLEMRQQTERYLESKAEAILTRVVGPGNSSVRVAAEMNFDQTSTTTQRVDPESLVAVAEETSEIKPSSGQTGAGQTTSSTQFEATRSMETFQSGASRIERLSVAVLVNDRVIENPDGTTTVETRTPEELARIESLVRGAVGIAADRSDAISVVSVPFQDNLLESEPVVEPGFDIMGLIQVSTRPLIGIAGLITALMLGMRLMSNLKDTAPRGSQGGRRLVSDGPNDALPAGAMAPGNEAVPAQAQYISAPAPPQIQIQDPAMTARVLKAWMKEA